MKRLIFVFTTVLTLIFALGAEARKRMPYDPPEEPPVPLSYTHILPSAFIIPGGSLVLGTTVGIGFFDVFDVSTNLFLDFAQDFNVGAKVTLWRGETWAAAVFANFYDENYTTLNAAGNSATATSTALAPGAVVSYYLTRQLTGHTGFTYYFMNPNVTPSMLNGKNGFLQGAVGNQEFTLGLTRTIALSSGVSYDFIFNVFGAGASFHLGGFQIGGHYYFNVATNSFLPILGGAFTTNY